MAYELPKLNFAYDALEPHIDAKTMEIHLTKHHQAYVSKVNDALEGTEFANMNIEDVLGRIGDVPEAVRSAVQNNGGGHANHSLFWTIIGPGQGGMPKGNLAQAIDGQLGGFEKFTELFTNAALTRFGSGWAWLTLQNGNLTVESSANQDSPLMEGKTPILGLDVWEHAYYLNYQNRRPDYVKAFWNIVDWEEVGRRFDSAS